MALITPTLLNNPQTVCVCVLFRPKITRLDFKKSRLTLVVVEDDDKVCILCHVYIQTSTHTQLWGD